MGTENLRSTTFPTIGIPAAVGGENGPDSRRDAGSKKRNREQRTLAVPLASQLPAQRCNLPKPDTVTIAGPHAGAGDGTADPTGLRPAGLGAKRVQPTIFFPRLRGWEQRFWLGPANFRGWEPFSPSSEYQRVA